MNARINSFFLNQTSFDSASPVGSAVVAHRFAGEGDYEIELGRAGHSQDRVALTVGPAAGDRGAAGSSIAIDAAPAAPGRIPGQRRSKVNAGGYVSFHTLHSRGAESVIVARRRGNREPEFDSRSLGPGDVFAVTLLRPGTYLVRNAIGGAAGRITVSYPEICETPYVPADPVTITCTDGGLQPVEVGIGPAQGVIFGFETAARLQIELAEPDDGPAQTSPRPGRRPTRNPEPKQ